MARFNPDGSLDPSFDGDGKVTTRIGYRATGYAVTVQSDNKIVVAGWSWDSAPPYIKDLFAVARYNSDGSLDMTFGNGGKVSTTICANCNDEAVSVALQPDGKIVAAGGGYDGTPNVKFTVVRYNADGSLDTTFDSDGIVITPFGIGASANAVTTQGDGKIVAASSSFALVRYNSNGSLDTTFDLDGKVATPKDFSIADIAIQSDGKIVAAGTSNNGTNNDFALVRYNPNGSLDNPFGGGDGETAADFNNSSDGASRMALDSAGRAVVVGDSDGKFAIARFLLVSAQVSVSGRVTTPDGRGLRNATVSITDTVGARRTATTSSFGFYSFSDIPAGAPYTISVASRLFRFTTRTITVNDNLTDIDFGGLE